MDGVAAGWVRGCRHHMALQMFGLHVRGSSSPSPGRAPSLDAPSAPPAQGGNKPPEPGERVCFPAAGFSIFPLAGEARAGVSAPFPQLRVPRGMLGLGAAAAPTSAEPGVSQGSARPGAGTVTPAWAGVPKHLPAALGAG